MDDPKVTIGGREFVVPEFSIWAQRKVSPALMAVASAGADIGDPAKFSALLDAIYLAITIETVDGKPDGKPINEITKDEFECLRMKALPLATEVLPLLLRQAGLTRDDPAPALNGKGGAAQPDSPLPGENTSTTSSPTSSSPPTPAGETLSS